MNYKQRRNILEGFTIAKHQGTDRAELMLGLKLNQGLEPSIGLKILREWLRTFEKENSNQGITQSESDWANKTLEAPVEKNWPPSREGRDCNTGVILRLFLDACVSKETEDIVVCGYMLRYYSPVSGHVNVVFTEIMESMLVK